MVDCSAESCSSYIYMFDRYSHQVLLCLMLHGFESLENYSSFNAWCLYFKKPLWKHLTLLRMCEAIYNDWKYCSRRCRRIRGLVSQFSLKPSDNIRKYSRETRVTRNNAHFSYDLFTNYATLEY